MVWEDLDMELEGKQRDFDQRWKKAVGSSGAALKDSNEAVERRRMLVAVNGRRRKDG